MSGSSSTASSTERRPTSWRPQKGPQKALVDCPFQEVLFGGARGGGKTDGVLGKYALKEMRFGPGFNAVFFRREMPQADDLIERAKEIYLPTGAEWREQARMFLMPHGGRVRFRPLYNATDADKYQGQNLSDAAVEEAGNYPDSVPIDKLFGALRSKAGVPIQLILTANPGGAGQHWIKSRFVDPAPMGRVALTRELPGEITSHRFTYIPSKVSDNRLLLASDPGYVQRLAASGSPELVRAWLDGDWTVVAGAYFPEFSLERHVVAPCVLPAHWTRFRAFDWGSAKPFACLWFAVSDGTVPAFRANALVVYREWYGSTGAPNVGLRLTAEKVGEGILAREPKGEKIVYSIADPALLNEDGGPSMAERMRGIVWEGADNSRVAGWDQVRARLVGSDDKSALHIFSTCSHLIRTLPALQHDTRKAEDVDSDGEDHACFAAGIVIDGLGPVEVVGHLTRCATDVVRLVFEDGREVVCTPDHKFLGEHGQWIQARRLEETRVWSGLKHKSSLGSAITFAASIINARVCDFTGWCGRQLSVLSRTAITSITRTRIGRTMPLETWSFCPAPSMWLGIADSIRRQRFPKSLAPPLLRGMEAKREGSGTLGIGIPASALPLNSAWPSFVSGAGEIMRRAVSRRVVRGSVTPTARLVRCVRVEPQIVPQDVYCLASPDGWLSVAGGIVASNCDALRYGCMSRPWKAPPPKPVEPVDPWDNVFRRKRRGGAEGWKTA